MDIYLKIRPVIQNSIVRIMKTVQYVRNSVAYNMHSTALPGLKLLKTIFLLTYTVS